MKVLAPTLTTEPVLCPDCGLVDKVVKDWHGFTSKRDALNLHNSKHHPERRLKTSILDALVAPEWSG